MQDLPDFDGLCELEPRLRELEAHVSSVHDDGTKSFFCSNYVWLPINSTLRELLGVARVESETDPLARDSRAYEAAYVHLSTLMPPCRACGCWRFDPYRGRS